MDKKKNGKRAFWGVILFLPLAVIAYLAITYVTQGITPESVNSIEITDPHGHITYVEDSESIEFYLNCFRGSEEIASPIRELAEDEAVTFTFNRKNGSLVYRLYPELGLTGNMVVDKDGRVGLISREESRNLLLKPELEYIYQPNYLPSLFIRSADRSEVVHPDNYQWFYKKTDDSYSEYRTQSDLVNPELFYLSAGAENSIYFTVEPDIKTVSLVNESGYPFQENEISNLIFSQDTLISAEITVEWLQSSNSNYHGKAVYKFDILYDFTAEFTTLSAEVKAGGYIKIDAKNISKYENIDVTAGFETGSIVFSDIDGESCAVIGVPSYTAPGDYDLELSTGKIRHIIEVKVLEFSPESYRLPVDSAQFEQRLGEEAENELKQLISEMTKASDYTAGLAFSKELAAPVEKTDIAIDYGTLVTINIDNSSIGSKTYSSIGISYNVKEGDPVKAAKNGKVVFAGDTKTLGNLVILDHGFGMLTWYYGLKSFNTQVGIIVNTGDIIGNAGIDNLADEPRAGFCVSAGGIFVNPN